MTAAPQFPVSRLHLVPAPAVPEIRLYRAHARSRLAAWLGEDAPPPYWAWGWAGGTVLARYVFDHPEAVRGRRVFDAGTGSGIVAIAAAMSGAASVTAMDIDPLAVEAARRNAEANEVVVDVLQGDATVAAPEVDLILAGDVVYDEDVARRMTVWFETCRAAGIEVLLGDPGRACLPSERLRVVAEYTVPDFGSGEAKAQVFAFGDQGARPLEP